MATLDRIMTGQLLLQDQCSLPEAIAHQTLYGNIRKRQQLFEILKGHFPERVQDGELKRTIEQVGKLTSIWSIFKTIENIADILEHIEQKLITVADPDGTVSYVSEESQNYQRFLEAAADDATGTDTRALIKDGMVCHAATKWYAVRIRHLIPNPPKGSGQPEEARDERSRIEMTRAGPAPIQLGTGCGSHAEGILTGRGAGGGRE